MRIKVTVGPASRIDRRVGRLHFKLLLKAIASNAYSYLSKAVSLSPTDSTLKWRLLKVKVMLVSMTIMTRVRRDLIQDVDVHEWSSDHVLIQFTLQSSSDPKYAAEAWILKVSAL